MLPRFLAIQRALIAVVVPAAKARMTVFNPDTRRAVRFGRLFRMVISIRPAGVHVARAVDVVAGALGGSSLLECEFGVCVCPQSQHLAQLLVGVAAVVVTQFWTAFRLKPIFW